jgi:choline dehydrogenase-like flavoprotein
MQSFYIDEWEEPHRVLLEATFTPLAFGGAWLAGTGAEHQRSMLDFGHVGSIGVHLCDRSKGRVGLANEGALRASYKLTDEDTRQIAFGIARAAEIHFAAGASEVYPNIPRVGALKQKDLPLFESTRFKPSELRLEAFHPMGTARISDDPRRGVCAPDGAVNGTNGLYVADASLFPTSVGVNPMMTIIAFAKQVARGIATAEADHPAPTAGAAEAVAS